MSDTIVKIHRMTKDEVDGTGFCFICDEPLGDFAVSARVGQNGRWLPFAFCGACLGNAAFASDLYIAMNVFSWQSD